MSTQLPTFVGIGISAPKQRSARQMADTALKASARFWFVVVVLGQLLFAFQVASFYGLTALQGRWKMWNKSMTHGYDASHPIGNVVVMIHVGAAALILLSGALQLIPMVQRRAPVFHRWNGRVYMVTAFAVSLAGLYMMWFRGSVGDIPQHIGQSLDAVLIMVFAVQALRYALVRDFKTHRRWALRLFMAVSASLFIRAGVFLSLVLNHGPFGFDPLDFSGPFLTFISFAQYLLPLAVLELYLRTQQRAAARGRFAMAAGIFVITLGMGAGIAAAAMATFLPRIRQAYDQRISIADTLASTIATGGIDQAMRQYQTIKATAPAKYNLDEDELNVLGYQLIQERKLKQAIRVFQLNVDAYPNSANTWDSLGEAYMDDGDKPQAIASYQHSLRLNPRSTGAVKMLHTLGVNKAQGLSQRADFPG